MQLNQSLLNSKKLDNESQTPQNNLSYTRDNSTRFPLHMNSKSIQEYPAKNYQNRYLSSSIVQQPTSTGGAFNYLYKFWKGQHTFFLQGLIQLGPKVHYLWNVIFWVFILMMGTVHLACIIPYLMSDVSLGIGVTYIIIFSLLIVFMIFTQFSDPGYIPRRKMIKSVPVLHDRITNVDEMINEKAYTMIIELQNEQQQGQKLGQVDNQHLKMSGINTSRLDNSYGNHLMNARTNMQSDFYLFKKAGSIQTTYMQKNSNQYNNSNNNNCYQVTTTQKAIDNNENENTNQLPVQKLTPRGTPETPTNNDQPATTIFTQAPVTAPKRSPQNQKIQMSDNALYKEIVRKNECRFQDSASTLQKNSFPKSSQAIVTQDQAIFRQQNPFVPVAEANPNNRRPHQIDQWTEETERNTTEFQTSQIADVEEREEYEEEESNDQQQQENNQNHNSQNIMHSEKREKFHMHIQIQNENNNEENKDQNEEMKKRRTIFCYLDKKASRQRESSLSQCQNSASKIDTQQFGDRNNDFPTENKTTNQNFTQEQFVNETEGGSEHIILRDQFENCKTEIKTLNDENQKQGHSDQKIHQVSYISSKSANESSNSNFLQVKRGVLLQESMISPKINVDSIIQKCEMQNEFNENYSSFKRSNCLNNVVQEQTKHQYGNSEVRSEQDFNNQVCNNSESVRREEQIDDHKSQESISYINQGNKKEIFINNPEILTANQNKHAYLGKNIDPLQRNRENRSNEENSRYFKEIYNQINNNVSSTQVPNLFQKTIFNRQLQIQTESQESYKGEDGSPNKANTIFSKQIISDYRSGGTHSRKDNQPNNILKILPEGNEENEFQQSQFSFKAQKCTTIKSNHLTNHSSSNQDQHQKQQEPGTFNQNQGQQYESIVEENKESKDLSSNQEKSNIFFKSKNQTYTLPFISQIQESSMQGTNTVTNLNEEEQSAHQQFMMLSQQSNQITPQNGNSKTINLKINPNISQQQNNLFENPNHVSIITGNKSNKANSQAIKLNEKFSYEMARHEQNVKRLSDSLMQQAPLNASMVRQKNETVQNKNIFDQLQNSFQQQQLAQKEDAQFYNGRKYCVTCKIFRPPRASHCTYCDCCVEVFDHHCKFVNNCIGKHNYKYFFSFLTLLNFTFLLQLISEIQYISYKKASSSDTITQGELAMGIIYIVIILLSWLYVLYLWGFHIYIQYKQLTTREQLRELDGDRDPQNYFNWCSSQNPIFQARIVITDNQRYDLLDDY